VKGGITETRLFSREFAIEGTGGYVDMVKVIDEDYEQENMGIYTLEIAGGQTRLVRLVWFESQQSEEDFGIGFEAAEGAPVGTLPGTRLGEKCYGVSVNGRIFNVYLR
jgi:hypothetical protein